MDGISWTSAGVALFGVSCILLAWTTDYSPIPGPFVARFTRLWFCLRARAGHFHDDNKLLHHKCGPIVRYAPGHYSFSDPEAVKVIYGKGTETNKSRWYEAWNPPGFMTLFNEPSVKAHGQLWRRFQATYSMTGVVSYETYVDSCVEVFCERPEEFAKSGAEFDLGYWMLCFAADTISMVTYSKRMGFMDAGEDIGDLFKNLHRNMLYSTPVGIYAWIHPLVFTSRNWLRRMGLTKESNRTFVANFTSERVSARRVERAQNEKPARRFLDAHEADASKFREHDIAIGSISNIVAGSDTVTCVLTAVLYCLLKHPSCLAKTRQEISSRTRNGELSSRPTFKQVQSTPYLQAVIQEAMRLVPVAGMPLQRVVPPGGAHICGRFFPAGSVVAISLWVFQHSTSIHGQDAEAFRLERWLEADKEHVAEMNRYWMPFGLCSRTCIGKHVALLVMNKMLPVILEKFDFELRGGLEEEGKEMEWVSHIFVRSAGLPVRVRLREAQQAL